MSESGCWQDDFVSAAAAGGGAAEALRVSAQRSALPLVLDYVAELSQKANLSAEDSARLAILVEELFLNSVTHGQAGQSDGVTPGAQIQLAISVIVSGQVRVDYRDQGCPFNPLTDGPAVPEPAGDVADYLNARVGGVGLWLLRKYALEAEYSRQDGVNRLVFQLGEGSLK